MTDKVRAQADQITAGVTDRREQAHAGSTNGSGQRIRYVGVEVGTGTLLPHEAETVLTNGYGDCKDHVVLFSALLKAKGIKSEFVLINLGNNYSLPTTAVVGELEPCHYLVAGLPSSMPTPRPALRHLACCPSPNMASP